MAINNISLITISKDTMVIIMVIASFNSSI